MLQQTHLLYLDKNTYNTNYNLNYFDSRERKYKKNINLPKKIYCFIGILPGWIFSL